MSLQSNFAEKVRKQVSPAVEFYFSNSNLPSDRFLLELTKKHPEGYVELATICGFARMLNLLNLPPHQRAEEIPNSKISRVAEALAESHELEVCEEKDHVRRRHPLKDEKEVIAEVDARSIFSAPLPFDCTIDGLKQEFSQHAPVRCVRLRRYVSTHSFRGSVFVEFETEDDAKRIVGKTIKIAGAEQEMQLKKDYLKRKYRSSSKAEKGNSLSEAGKASEDQAGTSNAQDVPSLDDNAAPNSPQASSEPSLADGLGLAGQNGLSAAAVDDGKEATSSANKDQQPIEGSKRKRENEDVEPQTDSAGSPNAKIARDANTSPKPFTFTPGVALKLDLPFELAAEEQTTFQDIKAALGGRDAGVGFLEYKKGEQIAWARMCSAAKTQELLDKRDADEKLELELNGNKVEIVVSLLQGDEEIEFHRKAQERKNASEARRHSGGGEFKVWRKGGKGGRGHRGRGRGRYGRRGTVI